MDHKHNELEMSSNGAWLAQVSRTALRYLDMRLSRIGDK
jgi:hypothetical protein